MTDAAIHFEHGLGDCVHCARILQLYAARNHRIEISCTPDKAPIFRAAGVHVSRKRNARGHGWNYPTQARHAHNKPWDASKFAHQISRRPLPDIGTPADLWDELCCTRLRPNIPEDRMEEARKRLGAMARPIILFHQKGNTNQKRKSLSDRQALEFYEAFLSQPHGTLVLLDWDRRAMRIDHPRIRHLTQVGPCPTVDLLAMMRLSDLLVGVDSGPLHLANAVGLPSVGVWRPGHYPVTYSLPSPTQLNLVLESHTRHFNRFYRVPYSIVDQDGTEFDMTWVCDRALQMLSVPAHEIFLDHLIGKTAGGENLGARIDRHHSLDFVFRWLRQRPQPNIVETGTIRAVDDWSAGFFTYLASIFCKHSPGARLTSIDINGNNCKFAREWADGANVIHSDSVTALKGMDEKIDLLYVDSMDTEHPKHAEHALAEMKAAEPLLAENPLVVVDDSPGWKGKGALVIPYLLARGWRVRFSGYQTILEKWQ